MPSLLLDMVIFVTFPIFIHILFTFWMVAEGYAILHSYLSLIIWQILFWTPKFLVLKISILPCISFCTSSHYKCAT